MGRIAGAIGPLKRNRELDLGMMRPAERLGANAGQTALSLTEVPPSQPLRRRPARGGKVLLVRSNIGRCNRLSNSAN